MTVVNSMEASLTGVKMVKRNPRFGLSETQLSLLRTGKVRGMRFWTLSKLCHVLECSPGDILEYDRNDADLYTDEDTIRAAAS